MSQSKEVIQLREDLEDQEKTNRGLEETNERLKNRLDDKDEQIGHLKEKLNDKDEQIEHLKARLNEKDAAIQILQNEERLRVRSDGTSEVRISDLFAAAQSAAEEYLRNIHK